MPSRRVPIVQRPSSLWVARTVIVLLVLHGGVAHAVPATWLGGTGNWDDASQWSTDPLYPCNGQGGFDYEVSFSSGEVTLNLDCTIDDYTQSGGIFDGGFDLTIDQVFDWTGGVMGGSGTTTVNGGLDVTGGGTKSLDGTRTLVHAGGIGSWTQANISLRDEGATFRNETTWNITGVSRSLSDTNDTGSFENTSTGIVNLDLDNATRAVTFSPGSLQNDGTMNANLGILVFNGDGTHTGTFAGAATFRIAGGTHTLGTGANLTVADFEVTNGAVDVDPGASFSPTNTDIVIGTLNVTGAADTITTATASQSGGNLGGPGTFEATGSYEWTGGTMRDAGTTRLQGGLNAGGSTKRLEGTRTLIHAAGTGSWTQGNFSLADEGATFRNETTWNLTGGTRGMTDANDTGTFENTAAGVLNVTLDDATRVVTISPGNVQNDGTVNANLGVLAFNGDGTHTGDFAGGGTFRVAGGSQTFGTGANVTVSDLEVTGGTLNAEPGASVSPSNVDISLGALNVTDALDTVTTATATQASGFLGGPGDFQATGSFTWSGGRMQDAGTTRVGGGLVASGAPNKFLDGTRTLVLEGGTSSWSQGNILLGDGGATVRNEATWNVTGGSRSMSDSNDTGTFENTNTGIVNVDLDDATRVVTISPGNVQNDGTLNVNQGILVFSGDGTHTGDVAGAGTFRVAGGTQTLAAGTVTVAEFEVSAGTLDVDPGASYAATNTDISGGGTLNVTGSTDTITSTTATQSGGTLGGPGSFQTTGSFAWTAGTMADAGTTRVGDGLNVSGSGTKRLAGTRTLIHEGGTGSWSQGIISLEDGGATFRNEATWNVTGPNLTLGDSNDTGSFENTATGVVNVDLEDETRTLTMSPGNLQSDGTFNINLGTLIFNGTGTHTGSFAGSSTFRISGGTQTLGAGASVTVADLEVTFGTLDVGPDASYEPSNTDISGGTLNVTDAADTITSGTATMSGGTLGGPGTFATTGSFAFSNGTMGDAGTTRVGGGLVVSGGAIKDLDGTRTLVHEGGIGSWSQGPISLGNDGATLRNETTWNVTGTTRELSDVADTGSFENAATGVFNVALDDAAQELRISTGSVSNAGGIDLQQGTVDFSIDFVQTSGFTRLSGGRLESSPGLDFQGGSLEGSGDIAADVSMGGTLAPGVPPGLSAGQIDIAGSLGMVPGASFEVEILGATPGTGYDTVTTTDSVVLAGNFGVEVLEGFRDGVSMAEPFTVLEDTSGGVITGGFANVGNGNRVYTSALDSFVVRYGAGSATGADRVVLDDFVKFEVASTLDVSGTAQGGTITLEVAGVEIVVVLMPGMTAEEVAEAIAAAINANSTLREMGIAATVDGTEVITNGPITKGSNTDPGIMLNLVPRVPSLQGLALGLLATLLAAAGVRQARRLGPEPRRRGS